jgi:hypothetical protein
VIDDAAGLSGNTLAAGAPTSLEKVHTEQACDIIAA